MRSATPVNADPAQCVTVDTNALPWEKTEHPGVHRKTLELVNDPRKGRETSLLRFEPGAALPAETLAERLDLFVIEGRLADGGAVYGPETLLRLPPGGRLAPRP